MYLDLVGSLTVRYIASLRGIREALRFVAFRVQGFRGCKVWRARGIGFRAGVRFKELG